MKRLILCFYATFFIITKMIASDVIGTINNQGEITGSNNYIDSFWYNNALSHNTSSYVEKHKMTITTSDGHYVLRLYRHTESANNEVKEDIEAFGDVFFTKLVIDYYNKNGGRVSYNTFNNDGYWFKYNYWTFAPYTDSPWKETKDITAYVVNLTGDIKAIVLRGMRDSIDPPFLSVFILFQGKTKLVFNKRVEVNAVSSDVSRTIFDVEEEKYDSNGNLTPKRYKIIFESGSIVVV